MEDIARPLDTHGVDAATARQTAVVDIAGPLYARIDWARSLVAGSYALAQYTHATWRPRDIDIMVQCNTHAAFEAEVARFCGASLPAARVDKITLLTDAMRRETVASGREERFHESIVATATLSVPGVPLPVQLVALDTTSNIYGTLDLLSHLNTITDLPSCVSYTVRAGQRIFHVPERGLAALRTHWIHVDHTCKARRAKYVARGYEFFGARP